MTLQEPLREQERENYDYFLSIPNTDAKFFKPDTVKGSQLIMPLFEYSGACAGCGETAYVKLLDAVVRRQGDDRQCDRLLIDLWRQSADDSLYNKRRRQRADLEQQLVRR